ADAHLHTRNMRTPSLLAVLAATLLVLTACAAAPAATQSPMPTPLVPVEPTPGVVTPPAEPEAWGVLVTGGGFAIVAKGGEPLFEHVWADEAAPALVALEEAFGSAPAESIVKGDGMHYGDFALYSWEGFAFADVLGLTKPRTDYFLPSYVEISAPTTAGLVLRTVSGVAVGTTLD